MIDIPQDRVMKAVRAKKSDGDKCYLCILYQMGIGCSSFACFPSRREDRKDVYFKLVSCNEPLS